MIALAEECLVFQLANGDQIPFSPEMLSIDLLGAAAQCFDPEFVRQTCHAVFHYFKCDLQQSAVTMADFSAALEKALQGFPPAAQTRAVSAQAQEHGKAPGTAGADLGEIACESGKGCELFFFPRLRDEFRHQLKDAPGVVRFYGLRRCVKQLLGAQRWSGRCREMRDQIVEYLRRCLNDCPEASRKALVVS